MKVTLSGNIHSTPEGFQKLIFLHDRVRSCTDPVCEIDMSDCWWLDANMCAAMGAILYPFSGVITVPGIKYGIEEILQKNGFLTNFGFNREKKQDTHGTTIEYQRFNKEDSKSFKEYVAHHFIGKGIPNMSPALHKKFRESIAEIFENALEHSETEHGIFACGQYFPWNRRLDFSIADLGIGIRNNIHRKIGLNMSSENAISWALEGDNTTRQREEGKPGGLGLKLIKEFIRLNNGKIQIISDAGYWCYYKNEITTDHFPSPFPGTVVNIEINTADKQSYCLASEIDPKEIF